MIRPAIRIIQICHSYLYPGRPSPVRLERPSIALTARRVPSCAAGGMSWLAKLTSGTAVLLMLAAGASAEALSSSQGALRIEKMAQGLDIPWAFDFLPDGSVLITERAGNLLLLSDGRLTRIKGTPKVTDQGQGGLLDVMVPRTFAKTRRIYLTYAKRVGRGSATAVATGQLARRNTQLQGLRDIFVAAPAASSGRHFGSRLADGPDGHIYVTLGDRGDRQSAQVLASHQGSILRLTPEGSVPRSNPLIKRRGAQPEIWSYGHRNPQGLTFAADGSLWSVEHGARGGDEVNRVEKGANYGWPIISYGRHYSGLKIGEGTEKPGLKQPEHYWDPSIAPSNLLVYSGKMWPDWRGDVFVGSLKFDYIARLSGAPLKEVEQIKGEQTGRIRDLREAPDGSIWFASETDGAIYRLSR
ncbi:Glucose/sorbosone dehydrogenase [Phaeobacter gallaeciensis]|uniref:Glucose/sorbosone dehydrogenase n=2 Tax=Phaeobacter gallaeciensis TaxID=60890 RepID=A0AAC9ZAH6_9RHOB|nr:Glucose/sorbosone dehydrogenase [Phaeobacter gallaeciensis DSM 26640]ATE92834.1 Glucose/sorbosone dehydrogenase [Phaeobacter gallaeciensis]ATE97344.1 Glucose/sorbosone dehydrogenase [Phaeobacter gallaeciensis]ATF01499.1 Glucose/sorbosone dehydrogenase [Phaeobacter gallaeciensis]ATF05879.1 Glucose/sorbosone dehydrogenase [Phaeobacter gallaeciensis]